MRVIVIKLVVTFILLTCESGKQRSIIEELERLDTVKEVNGTMGSFDILVKLESSTHEEIRNAITMQIRKIDNVRSTLTLKKLQSQG